jgi:prolyl-tRNA editing enzyme YbaK/EbsC (Cys-tRNA(Pro) deacylase)
MMSNDHKILSKSAQNVQNILSQKGLVFEVIELSSSTRTAQDAANTIGCEIAQIVKSLLFRTKSTSQPVLILASGINRVHEKTIEKMILEKITKADADFTREITGYAIGGIPPVGHKQKINHIFIDKDLLKFETLWAAAGTPNAVFRLRSSDLESLTGER